MNQKNKMIKINENLKVHCPLTISPGLNGQEFSPAGSLWSYSPCSSIASAPSVKSITSFASSSTQIIELNTKVSDGKVTKTKTRTCKPDPRKRLAANARERKRMHLLNEAYDKLRKRLRDAENKSKYDVLVQAREYIRALADICEKFDREQQEKGKDIFTRRKLSETNSARMKPAQIKPEVIMTSTNINNPLINSLSTIQSPIEQPLDMSRTLVHEQEATPQVDSDDCCSCSSSSRTSMTSTQQHMIEQFNGKSNNYRYDIQAGNGYIKSHNIIMDKNFECLYQPNYLHQQVPFNIN